jgi:hypothetical protein
VREAQYLDLTARRQGGQVKSLMFIHLKKDLDPDPVNWVDCMDPIEVTDDARPKERRGPLTGYGILKTVQDRLAAVRTDLDSFTDMEAFALMLSGYRMTEREFAACVTDVPVSNAQNDEWRFLSVEPAMSRSKDFEEAHDYLMRGLKASDSRAFKIWRLSWGVTVFGGLSVVLLAGLLVEAWVLLRPLAPVSGFWFTWIVVLLPILAAIVFRIGGIKKPVTLLAKGMVLSVAGWTVALFHLLVFDPGFLAWGRVKSKRYSGAEGSPPWIRPVLACVVLAILFLGNPFTLAEISEVRGNFEASRDFWSMILRLIPAPTAYVGRATANRVLGFHKAAVSDCGRLPVAFMTSEVAAMCEAESQAWATQKR